MERFENWMSYSYDGVEYGKKQVDTTEFTINYNKKISKPLPSYKDALLNNAKIMREMYNAPFDVCLSGGIDSVVVVRTFKELKIKHNTVIFRLENNHNYRDVQSAVELCTQLNISYKIIDFNILYCINSIYVVN
jgi:tRNA(Ile)-lysidine synthase TilS/MesJ